MEEEKIQATTEPTAPKVTKKKKRAAPSEETAEQQPRESDAPPAKKSKKEETTTTEKPATKAKPAHPRACCSTPGCKGTEGLRPDRSTGGRSLYCGKCWAAWNRGGSASGSGKQKPYSNAQGQGFKKGKGEKLTSGAKSHVTPVQEGLEKSGSIMNKTESTRRDKIEHAKTKGNVKYYNQLLSSFAQERELGWAIQTYFQMWETGISPTIYTITNFLNACVRCGDLERAKQAWQDMKDLSIEPNEVTYTVLLKGLTQNGNCSEGLKLITEMIDSAVQPNVRTCNTLLRACYRYGDPATARAVVAVMTEKSVPIDSTTIEYVVTTLCHAGSVEESTAFLDSQVVGASSSSGSAGSEVQISAATYLILATSCAMAGDFGKAKEWIEKAERANESGSGSIDMEEYQFNEKSAASAKLFMEGRKKKISEEISELRKYMDSFAAQIGAKSKQQATAPRHALTDSPQVFLLTSPESRSTTGALDFPKIFGNENREVRVEICSGHGDWIIEWAQKEPGINWIAVEIRHERIYNIWVKMIQKGIKNLVLLEGDAVGIVNECIPEASIDKLYCNFPEPPSWDGAPRLLSKEYLTQINQKLKPEGSFILATDHRECCIETVDFLSELSGIYKSNAPVPFRRALPADYGTSYFEQFWSRGKKSERFYVDFVKTAN